MGIIQQFLLLTTNNLIFYLKFKYYPISDLLGSVGPAPYDPQCEDTGQLSASTLKNVTERAAMLSMGPMIDVDDLLVSERAWSTDILRDIKRWHIEKVLDKVGWRREGLDWAASRLDINPSTLRAQLRKLGITKRM